MRYNLVEILISVLDVFIFNNPIGISATIVAFFISILMCIYGNKKIRVIYVCSLLLLTILCVIICVFGNSPDYLVFPVLMLPFFIITSIVFILYFFIKMLTDKII